MSKRNSIGKVVAGIVLTGALTIASLPGGAAYADEGAFASAGAAATQASGDGDVDGRDFLIWQRGSSPSPVSAGDLAIWQSNYGVDAASSPAAGSLGNDYKYIPVRR